MEESEKTESEKLRWKLFSTEELTELRLAITAMLRRHMAVNGQLTETQERLWRQIEEVLTNRGVSWM